MNMSFFFIKYSDILTFGCLKLSLFVPMLLPTPGSVHDTKSFSCMHTISYALITSEKATENL